MKKLSDVDRRREKSGEFWRKFLTISLTWTYLLLLMSSENDVKVEFSMANTINRLQTFTFWFTNMWKNRILVCPTSFFPCVLYKYKINCKVFSFLAFSRLTLFAFQIIISVLFNERFCCWNHSMLTTFCWLSFSLVPPSVTCLVKLERTRLIETWTKVNDAMITFLIKKPSRKPRSSQSSLTNFSTF